MQVAEAMLARLPHRTSVSQTVVGGTTASWLAHRTLRSRKASSVAIVGLGYVGLPTALSFADVGVEVVGFDISTPRLTAIQSAKVDLLPRDLTRLKTRLTKPNTFKLTSDPAAIATTGGVIICVPTPVDKHLNPDLTALASACKAVVEHAAAGQVIVLTSTTYVGCTNDMLIEPLRKRGFTPGEDIFVAFSPERIDPGVANHAPETTPRVVGGATPKCLARALDLLRPTASALHSVSSPAAAEMTKLVENTFRAANIALANEFADVAHELDVNIMEVIGAAATKPYGFMPFYPGAGVGGHCIPCDPHYLLWQLKAHRLESPVIQSSMSGIALRPGRVVDRVRELLGDAGKRLAGARVLIVGVAYKPGVADLRESPALEIIEELARSRAKVSFTDSMIDELTLRATGTLTSLSHTDAAAHAWDVVVVHTVHPREDHQWLESAPVVLDTTFRLNLPEKHTL
ncbi:nucleotide sugar dehydrogenase [Smaragdicoccus niigatensis]|uniref:nucleotide sugar dehydrogenase n=1 Tax=Smaragdicoccus niigatensis TaxID=359359 RepID=UPI000378B284|nr:nucleotide sugar dehydrogenase [Smaragdicoccus niigatensis]